jgi:hypothetical protein
MKQHHFDAETRENIAKSDRIAMKAADSRGYEMRKTGKRKRSGTRTRVRDVPDTVRHPPPLLPERGRGKRVSSITRNA